VFILERGEPLSLRQKHREFRRLIGDLVVRVHQTQLRQQRSRQITERQAFGLVTS
jgi:hypothetical protein